MQVNCSRLSYLFVLQKETDTTISIDIIIPSYRLNEDMVSQVVNLPVPNGMSRNIYLIVDNPSHAIPASVVESAKAKKLFPIVNKQNKGVSASRNIGIENSTADWLLFLDDDIIPAAGLLQAYFKAIMANPEALGFAGFTKMPESFNQNTKALFYSGITGQFAAATKQSKAPWAPTSNLLISRKKLGGERFDEGLTASGEDIDLCIRLCLKCGQQFISAPDAEVSHPWWQNGAMPSKKIFQYGRGSYQIARKDPVRKFTYLDFTNTSESVLLTLIAAPFIVKYFSLLQWLLFLLAIIISELFVNYLKICLVHNNFSLTTTFKYTWIRIVREAGFLYESARNKEIFGFARRIETGFIKTNPSPFRLNRWKIIKLILLISMALAIAIYAKGAS